MLRRASSAFRATLLLVNAGFKHLASVHHPDVQDLAARELQDNGYLSYDTIQAIRRQSALLGGRDQDLMEYVSKESGNYTIVRVVRSRDILAARLIVILPGGEPDPYCSDLAGVLSDYISQYMFSNKSVDYTSNANFGALVADLIEFRLIDPEELEQRLKQIKLATRRYYHVILVSFVDKQEHCQHPHFQKYRHEEQGGGDDGLGDAPLHIPLAHLPAAGDAGPQQMPAAPKQFP